MARNPKDVIVSYFHYHKLFRFQKFDGDLESFANYFMSDKGRKKVCKTIFKIVFYNFSTCFFVLSFIFAFFPASVGRLVEATPPKSTLHFLRRSQESKQKWTFNYYFPAEMTKKELKCRFSYWLESERRNRESCKVSRQSAKRGTANQADQSFAFGQF